jgi:peptidoglycan/LPS O-acetylase OafA/YrhL
MRFDVLDAFRGVAALVVHVLHNLGLWAHLPSAALAIDFFFCMNDFVICHAYQGRLVSNSDDLWHVALAL